MTTDTELERWQQEWREHTDPLPELKKKIRRQNWQTAAAIAAICACIVLATLAAIYRQSAFFAGSASGMGVASILLGGYAWWVKRGAWKPAANTTLAYAELTYKRAQAKARILRFAFYMLTVAAVLFSCFLAWNLKRVHPRDVFIDAALIAELFYIKRQERRKLQEMQETKKLIEDIRE
jgi:predicted lysophospholipase L1 biosynthesis ABC-type transport system permease subunit